MFEEEKIFFLVKHDLFLENISQLARTSSTELSEKVQYSRNQAIKISLNEAILLTSINEALLSR